MSAPPPPCPNLLPWMGCYDNNGSQVIYYSVSKCLASSDKTSKGALLLEVSQLLDLFLPQVTSFTFFVDFSDVPPQAWLWGKGINIANAWNFLLETLAARIHKVLCYHVSFTSQSY